MVRWPGQMTVLMRVARIDKNRRTRRESEMKGKDRNLLVLKQTQAILVGLGELFFLKWV